MEIWGVQIPIDYVVVGGAILIAAALLVSSRLFTRYVLPRLLSNMLRNFQEAFDAFNPVLDEISEFASALQRRVSHPDHLEPVPPDQVEPPQQVMITAEESVRIRQWRDEFDTKVQKPLGRIRFVIGLIQHATTILTLLPLVGAIVALVSEHAELALKLDALGLVVFIVTKGGLWLLTMALIPILKGLPVGVGTGIGSYFAQRALKNRDKDREPAEKK